MNSRCRVAIVRSVAFLLVLFGSAGLRPGIAGAGTLDVSWTAPTTTVTGHPLTGLASFRIYYGTGGSGCAGAPAVHVSSSTPNPAPSQTFRFMLTGLKAGTAYYVGVTAVDATGQESACTAFPQPVAARDDFSIIPGGDLSFGSVSVGGSSDRTFTVVNAGSTTISGGATAATPFRVVAGSPYSVAAGGSAAVTVRFSPTTAAAVTSNVTFTGPGSSVASRVVRGSGAGSTNGVGSPLSLRLTAPSGGARVAGAAVVLAAATNNDAEVVGVQFKVNNLNLGGEVTKPPFRISWYTLSTPNGQHTLTAVARDAAGNVRTSAPVAVTLANADTAPPTVRLTAPASETTVAGPAVILTTDASDNVGVVGVQFKVNGLNLGSEVTKPPFRISWYTLSTPDGQHTLTAVARDAAGNVQTSAPVTVRLANVDQTPPRISLMTPAMEAIVAGPAVILTADTGDNVGVVGVQFKVNGLDLGSEVTIPPYRISWYTLSTPNGRHTITAVARDAAGNVTTSPPIAVTLRN